MPKSTKSPQSSTTRTRTRKSATPPTPSVAETTPSVAARPSVTAAAFTTTLNHDEIAHRAYELFLSNGAMHGRDIDHWLQAESELRSRPVNGGR